MKLKRFFSKSIVVIICAMLAGTLSLSYVLAAENEAPVANLSWKDEIDGMLEGRNYSEGEALALVDNTNGLPKMVEEGEADSEELFKVSEAESIQIVTDSEKTTEELLRELAEDPTVIYAQPNYINTIPKEEEPTEAPIETPT